MVLIGVDPHKATHAAMVVDDDERELARIKVNADRSQVAALLEFADTTPEHEWVREGNQGTSLTPARPAPHPERRLFG